MPEFYYAGIGSRETPKYVLEYFNRLGSWMALGNFVLRSGHADGADKAFEYGCDCVAGRKEIYLPWRGFNGSNSSYILSSQEAYDVAKQYHPYWSNLSDAAKKLQARNSHQILGHNLRTPSDLVICWTKDGLGQGGTGQAIRIAKDCDIPVIDAGSYGMNLNSFERDLVNLVEHIRNNKGMSD